MGLTHLKLAVLRVPWTARRSNQPILKEINPEYSLEGRCWTWSSNILATWCEQPAHWKRLWWWERLKAKEKVAAEDEMVREHGWLNGQEFEQTPGDSGEHRSLVCCSPWGCKESVTTEPLNNNKLLLTTLKRSYNYYFFLLILSKWPFIAIFKCI